MKKINLLMLLATSSLMISCGETKSTEETTPTESAISFDINDLESEGQFDTWKEVQAAANAWSAVKELPAVELPRLAPDGEKVFSYGYMLDDGYYADEFLVYVTGSFVDEYLGKLDLAGWVVPTKAGEYGYECIDKDGDPVYELDVSYNEEDNLTSIALYSWADLNGGGGEEDPSDFYDLGYLSQWSEVQTKFEFWCSKKEITSIDIPALDEDGQDAFYFMYTCGLGEYMIDCFAVSVEGDVVGSYLNKLETAGWFIATGDEEFVCYEKTEDPEFVLSLYSDTTEGEETWIEIYYSEDISSGEDDYGYVSTWAEIQSTYESWCVKKSLVAKTIPALGEDGENAFYYEISAGDSEYAPSFYIDYEGNVVNEYLAKLAETGWYVPSTATEYGYECLDDENNPTIEIDVIYVSEENLTQLYIYSYADIY